METIGYDSYPLHCGLSVIPTASFNLKAGFGLMSGESSVVMSMYLPLFQMVGNDEQKRKPDA